MCVGTAPSPPLFAMTKAIPSWPVAATGAFLALASGLVAVLGILPAEKQVARLERRIAELGGEFEFSRREYETGQLDFDFATTQARLNELPPGLPDSLRSTRFANGMRRAITHLQGACPVEQTPAEILNNYDSTIRLAATGDIAAADSLFYLVANLSSRASGYEARLVSNTTDLEVAKMRASESLAGRKTWSSVLLLCSLIFLFVKELPFRGNPGDAREDS